MMDIWFVEGDAAEFSAVRDRSGRKVAALRLLLIAALVVGWGHPPCPYECDDMGEDARP